ncbi:MAG TPA: glycosyl hydrolase 115 family protein [Candidatus Sulfotelmatobacter sp.]|nr:glycosyl hydrolase 115 family protein [Candidatus Sulfotelmatobacter sp.]
MHKSKTQNIEHRAPNIKRIVTAFVLFLFALGPTAFALDGPQYVETSPSRGAFPIVQNKIPANLVVDSNDFSGVLIAAGNLRTDISRVTGVVLDTLQNNEPPGKNLILIGTLGRSPWVDQLVRERKIDASSIAGKWESWLIQVVPKPFPGISKALVICGSDKRGTIFGIYDLSENIGVSPWYFWTDVPPKHHDELFVKPGKYVQGPPAVKYRGIFLNDEAPDLTGWANEKFGGYNHAFYTNIFELLLRLKANYLWPAMWNSGFGEDDPLNAKLADEYGIVMGTSHVEPMMRADQEWGRAGFTAREWNFQTHSNELKAFWREGIERNRDYEKIITIAMRGKVDTPMSPSANVALLEEIVAAQRQIISDVMHTNAADVPQLWALYKEVQEYYEKGMRVPDDVTLLWCDDNWGDIRRLPSPSDRGRLGGAGVYYHFDYVGGPRNYKWINSVQNSKTWEQMELACQYGADRIWIVNVGHLQHVTFPTEFFLTLAWDPKKWTADDVSTFAKLWASREFGQAFAPQIANVMSRYTKYSARRKPELLSPNTYSLLNYNEADRVLADWTRLAADATNICQKLPANERDAFFETVLYPVQASEIVNELYIDAAKNRLFAAQGRASANDYAARVDKLFQADAELSADYNHTLANGKWDHMMDQTHIGYTRWQQPPTNIMPAVTDIEVPEAGQMGVAIEGSTNAWPGTADAALLPVFDKLSQPTHYIDVFNKGKAPINVTLTTDAPWILISHPFNPADPSDPPGPPEASNIISKPLTIAKETRLPVSINWKDAPEGEIIGCVTAVAGTNIVLVGVPVFNPPEPSRDSVSGFAEADGYVSIEAEHFTRNVESHGIRWQKIPDLGRTLSSMSIFPVTAPSVMPPKHSPHLEYQMFLFDSGRVEVNTILSPTLNFVSGRGLRFALSFDDEPPRIVTAVPAEYTAGDGNHDWERTVADSARIIKTPFTLAKPGEHTLKVWMVDPGVVLQKIVVDCGGMKPSYLGPPESFHR